MTTTATLEALGASKSSYSFEIYPWGQRFRAVGAIYMVLKLQANQKYDIIYIGQTGNLVERFDHHHKANCFSQNGRTHIAIHQESNENTRFSKETDLIRNYNPGCNG